MSDIKTFEYGQQVRIAGYQALGVVTVGNKHCVENSIDTVMVAIGKNEMHCVTGDVEATGTQMQYSKCRTSESWVGHWVPVGSTRVEVQGHALERREITIYGRTILLFVPPFLTKECATEDEVKDDMCTHGQ